MFKMYLSLYLLLNMVFLNNALFDLSSIHRFFYKYVDEDSAIGNKDDSSQSSVEKLPCDENKLMLRLANLQVTSPERILLLMANEKLSDLCRKLDSNIGDVKHEFNNCISLPRDNLYWLLFQGIEQLHKQTCEPNSEIMKSLSIHYECLQDLREEYLECEGTADWFEKTNEVVVCQTYNDILNCDFVKTAELCGIEAAKVYRCITQNVFNKTLSTNKCNLDAQPEVENPMPVPEYSVENSSILSLSTTLFLYLFAMLLIY